ncbi:MAG: EAL domain-containing protein [Geminicoccaceae bacterium]
MEGPRVGVTGQSDEGYRRPEVSADGQAKLRDGLLADLVQRQPLLALINGVVALLFAGAMTGAASGQSLGRWLACMLAVQVARLFVWRRWRAAVSGADLDGAVPWLVACSAAAGCGWGVIGPLFSGLGSPAQQMLVPFFLAGMAAGAIGSLTQHRPAFYAFLLPALLPYALRLGAAPDPTSRLMGLVTLLYACGLAMVGHQMHESLRRLAKLHLRNEDLSARLDEARHDGVTGLPNRQLFDARLRQALALARRTGGRVGLLLVDLDRFKEVNDRYGHPAGDRLLGAVAERLVGAVRASDTLARIGGDEFALLQPATAGPDATAALAHRLQERLAEPLALGGGQLQVTASIGIALSGGETGPEALMERADLALYRAKGEGRGQFCFFEPEMEREVRRNRRIERDLRRALDRGELVVHYEPQLDLRTGRLSGVEAVPRWPLPDGGWMPADEFLPVTETSALGPRFAAWLIKEVCAQASAWRREGIDLDITIALSPALLRRAEGLEAVETAIAHDAARLELAIQVSEADADMLDILQHLGGRGIRLALDGMGIGAAILSRLPVDRVRLGASIVDGIGNDQRDEVAIRGAVAMANALGKEVCASAVASEHQYRFLRDEGCHVIQGPVVGEAQAPHQLRNLAGRPWRAGVVNSA